MNLKSITSLKDFLNARLVIAFSLSALLFGTASADASVAYGSINNFDTVNDTGVETHGFEIEIDDIHSTNITYTYDYNHYGHPKITEDNTDPLHPKVFVRYAGEYVNGAWSAHTIVPTAPIGPTQGHQFTNPAVNFGGEHFGVGYTAAPTAVKYNWLIDDGSHNLVHGPPVNVSTPTFTYVPPAAGAPAAVVAVIVPPPPPVPPAKQFGDATWVKEIKTKTHSAKKIALVDLVGDDPGKPQPWANGVDAADPSQIEVEVEWRILQTQFAKPANPKGVLQGKPEGLPGGNEVITRRYEFYKYTGPLDAETGEAMADAVAADGIHGSLASVTYADHFDPATGEWVTVTVDTRPLVIVGDFFGAQMAGFDVNGQLGLIDHLQDGALNVPYVNRTVVIAGNTAFDATTTGALPNGMSLDPVTGVLAGTPTESGLFTFDVSAADLSHVVVKKTYTLAIADNGALPPSSRIVTSASPVIGGSTNGSGTFANGKNVIVTAAPKAGYNFVNWTENGAQVSVSASYTFTAAGDRTLVANFATVVQNFSISTSAAPANLGTTSGDGSFANGASVTVTATPNAGATFVSWTEGGNVVSNSASYKFTASANRALVANFLSTFTITTSSVPAAGGSTSGGGSVNGGGSVTVSATANAGYTFVDWTEGGAPVSASPSYTFTAASNHALVANFKIATVAITAGTFNGLVANLPTPTAETSGLITITTTAGSGNFSATLLLGGNKFAFRGVLDAAGQATVKVKKSLTIVLQLDAAGFISGTVADGTNTTAFTARRCPYSAASPLTDWPGSYTHLIGYPRKARPPLPVGTGTHTISATGAVHVIGKLSDGTCYTSASLVTDAGSFPLYSDTALKKQAGFIVSDVALNAADVGSITAGSPLTWKPAAAQAPGRFTFFMSHYTPRPQGTAALKVDAVVHNLDILATNPIGGMTGSWPMKLGANNIATDLGGGTGLISLKITTQTGVVRGNLGKGASAQAFTGVVWQDLNSGFAILPGFNDAATLTLVPVYTGP